MFWTFQISPRVSPPDTAYSLVEEDKAGENGDVVMYGGGDQSHPGGLQMTPRQTSQGDDSGRSSLFPFNIIF